jgi:hypothetical protein
MDVRPVRDEHEGRRAKPMQFFVELLLWHVVIAAFLVGALMLLRNAQRSNSPMKFMDDASAR